MARMRLDPLFLIPTASLDPRAMASKIPSDARISLIVGADDDVAPPGLSRAFAAVLGERATVRIIPGGHEIFDRPEVLSAIAQMRAAR
jgi:predicted esterase